MGPKEKKVEYLIFFEFGWIGNLPAMPDVIFSPGFGLFLPMLRDCIFSAQTSKILSKCFFKRFLKVFKGILGHFGRKFQAIFIFLKALKNTLTPNPLLLFRARTDRCSLKVPTIVPPLWCVLLRARPGPWGRPSQTPNSTTGAWSS